MSALPTRSLVGPRLTSPRGEPSRSIEKRAGAAGQRPLGVQGQEPEAHVDVMRIIDMSVIRGSPAHMVARGGPRARGGQVWVIGRRQLGAQPWRAGETEADHVVLLDGVAAVHVPAALPAAPPVANALPKLGARRGMWEQAGTRRPSQIAPVGGNAAGRWAAGRSERVGETWA